MFIFSSLNSELLLFQVLLVFVSGTLINLLSKYLFILISFFFTSSDNVFIEKVTISPKTKDKIKILSG